MPAVEAEIRAWAAGVFPRDAESQKRAVASILYQMLQITAAAGDGSEVDICLKTKMKGRRVTRVTATPVKLIA